MDTHAGRALVVDDESTIRSLCRVILERMGFVVETCEGGALALHLLERISFDLLVIDLWMPDLDGVDVLERIHHRANDLATIVITGHASVEDTARITLLGAQGILLKPFTADAFRTVVNEVLRTRAEARAAAHGAALRPLLRLSERLLTELDLPRLCHQIVTTALEELQADYVQLMLRDEGNDAVRVVASVGIAQTMPEALHDHAAAWVMLHRCSLLLDANSPWPPELRDWTQTFWHQAALYVPLSFHGRALGVLHADKFGDIAFTPANQDLMTLLAGQVAIALENARLYSLAQRRADRFKKLNNFSTALTATLDLDQVLRITSQRLQDDLPIASGWVVLYDDLLGQFSQYYPLGAVTLSRQDGAQYAGGGLADQVLSNGEPRHLRNASHTDRLAPWEQQLLTTNNQDLLCVALATDKGIGGVIEVASRAGISFGDDDLQFVIAIAAPVALAVEKSRMHAMIVRSEARYRALLDHARDAVLLLNSEATAILEANPAAVAIGEYPYDQLRQLCPEQLIVPPSAHTTAGWLRTLLDSGTTEFEACIRTQHGQEVPVAVGVSEVIHDDTHYLLVIARDISERQRLAQRLVQTEKLAGMGRLAASIAHEINNPLQGLQNSLHLILNRPLDVEKREQILIKARDEVEQLVVLVQRLLDFYRPSLEGRRPIALLEILENVLALVAPQLQQGNIVVERDWDAYLPRVMGVGSHLKQVFLSLVLNAIDAMPRGGRLTMRTRVQESSTRHARRFVLVEFADTGPGISEDELPKIFEPFYTTRTNRTGLGLAISYSIVEKHEGTLSVMNSSEGATFCVALPAL